MKINNKKSYKKIAINHSADIDYEDFISIYQKFTNESYSFSTIELHYQLIILCVLEKCFDIYYKMTLSDEQDYNKSTSK